MIIFKNRIQKRLRTGAIVLEMHLAESIPVPAAQLLNIHQCLEKSANHGFFNLFLPSGYD